MRKSFAAAIGAALALTIVSGCVGAANYANPSAAAPITQRHGPPPHGHGDADKVKIWTTLFDDDELLGMDSSGKNEVAAIDTATNGCYAPAGMKVDHSRNIWVACEAQPSLGTSLLQEYSSKGDFKTSFPVQCAAFSSGYCSFLGSVSYDGAGGIAPGGGPYAVLGLTAYVATVCTSSCYNLDSTGIEVWYCGYASCPYYATYILLASDHASTADIRNVYYLDVDAFTDVWFTFYACTSSSHCGYGLGFAPAVADGGCCGMTVVEPPGTYGAAGGVYVSKGSGSRFSVVNVIDPSTSRVYQYGLYGSHFSYGQAPFNVLGPIAKGKGYPVSGGFDKTDSKMVIGDARNWLDIGRISSNTWTKAKSPEFTTSLYGAAYTPSDK